MSKNRPSNKVRNSLNTLKNRAHENREYGYAYSDSADPVELELANGSDNELTVPAGGDIWGASHTHPNPATTEFTPMFSVSDIYKLGEIAAKYTPPPGKLKNMSKFVLTLTTKTGQNGTQTFAVKIDNWQQFRQFVYSYGTMTDRERLTQDNLLNGRYLKSKKNHAGTETYLKDLFQYMHEKGYKGFSIYKAGPDLGNWAKQEYNPDTNIITPKPCN